jgi:hypothetical protein
MQFSTRFRPSPAMVVASLALLVALGGTSVAAVSRLGPKNSVGSDQVINGSLRNVDFKPGEVLVGSDAVSRSFDPINLRGDKATPVASLSIPKPGAYVILAHATIVNPTVGGGICTLFAHAVPGAAGAVPDVVSATSAVDQTGGTNAPTLWVSVVHGFPTNGGSIDLSCAGGNGRDPSAVRDIKITAVRLGGGD